MGALHAARGNAASEPTTRACAACSIKLVTGNEKMHPLLLVPVCLGCFAMYNEGEFSISDIDHKEIFCRWCGDGGYVLSCDYCAKGFCDQCINRNFGEGEDKRISALVPWSCYACEPGPLLRVRAKLLPTVNLDGLGELSARPLEAVDGNAPMDTCAWSIEPLKEPMRGNSSHVDTSGSGARCLPCLLYTSPSPRDS